MPLDPGKLTTDLVGDYSSYLSSRFHFRHEGLRRQFADLLAAERRLHSGPFLELMPPFRPGESIRELAPTPANSIQLCSLCLPMRCFQTVRSTVISNAPSRRCRRVATSWLPPELAAEKPKHTCCRSSVTYCPPRRREAARGTRARAARLSNERAGERPAAAYSAAAGRVART